MNSDFILELVYYSMFSSVISTQIIQKIKDSLKLGTKFNNILSLLISFISGFIFCYSFYNNNYLYCFWMGIFTLIGSESLYKKFKGMFGLNSQK